MIILDEINGSYIAYTTEYSLGVREYYFYCANLIKSTMEDLSKVTNAKPYNIQFGDFRYKFKNDYKTLKIDIQYEHTLVKPGGRGSDGFIQGTIPIENSVEKYLVRLSNYEYLKTLDLIIEYSRPNIINVKNSKLYPEYSERVEYIPPFIYDNMVGVFNDRKFDIITNFTDVNQPRRKIFLDQAAQAGLNIQNITNIYDHDAIKDLYQNTKILVNIRQTDHHDTFEELRVLPAIMNGVIVISESVPLQNEIPYHSNVIWCGYDELIETIKHVYKNQYDLRYKLHLNKTSIDNFSSIKNFSTGDLIYKLKTLTMECDDGKRNN